MAKIVISDSRAPRIHHPHRQTHRCDSRPPSPRSRLLSARANSCRPAPVRPSFAGDTSTNGAYTFSNGSDASAKQTSSGRISAKASSVYRSLKGALTGRNSRGHISSGQRTKRGVRERALMNGRSATRESAEDFSSRHSGRRSLVNGASDAHPDADAPTQNQSEIHYASESGPPESWDDDSNVQAIGSEATRESSDQESDVSEETRDSSDTVSTSERTLGAALIYKSVAERVMSNLYDNVSHISDSVAPSSRSRSSRQVAPQPTLPTDDTQAHNIGPAANENPAEDSSSELSEHSSVAEPLELSHPTDVPRGMSPEIPVGPDWAKTTPGRPAFMKRAKDMDPAGDEEGSDSTATSDTSSCIFVAGPISDQPIDTPRTSVSSLTNTPKKRSGPGRDTYYPEMVKADRARRKAERKAKNSIVNSSSSKQTTLIEHNFRNDTSTGVLGANSNSSPASAPVLEGNRSETDSDDEPPRGPKRRRVTRSSHALGNDDAEQDTNLKHKEPVRKSSSSNTEHTAVEKPSAIAPENDEHHAAEEVGEAEEAQTTTTSPDHGNHGESGEGTSQHHSPARKIKHASSKGKKSSRLSKLTGNTTRTSSSAKSAEKQTLKRKRSLRPRNREEDQQEDDEDEAHHVAKKSKPTSTTNSERPEEPRGTNMKSTYGKSAKKWLSHGLYVGQQRDFNVRATESKNKKKQAARASDESTHENKTLPMPMFNGDALLKKGRNFQLPFDVFSPLPYKTGGADEWWKSRGNRFIGDAGVVWKKNKPLEVSKCLCKPADGCGDDCQNRYMLYECDDSNCNIGKDLCTNRAFAELKERTKSGKPFDIGVEVMETKDKGYGVRASRPFEANQIIVEYAGEIITQAERDRRVQEEYKDNESYYLMTFDQNMIIDATRGTIARYVNHSCEPNCKMIKWTVAGKPRMALFAGDHDIMTGEELTYDYKFDPFSQNNVQVCKCGAQKCRGFIGPKPAKTKENTTKADNKNGKASTKTAKSTKRQLDEQEEPGESSATKRSPNKRPRRG